MKKRDHALIIGNEANMTESRLHILFFISNDVSLVVKWHV